MTKKSSNAIVSVPRRENRSERGGNADFGHEGTNKTLPAPEVDAEPSVELPGIKAKYIPKTPYTRG